MEIQISTVGYWIRGERGMEEIYLGTKAASPKAVKRKIAGKLLSFGGDFEEDKDRSPAECFQRELLEETSITKETGKIIEIIEPGFSVDLKDLEAMARIRIYDENGFRLMLYYFLSRDWKGELKKHTDILDPKWYPIHPLPDNLLESDKLVLPSILMGIKVAGMVRFDKDMRVVASQIAPVESIE